MKSLSAASEVNGGSAPSFVQNCSWCHAGVSWRSKSPEADLWGRSRGLLFLLKPLLESRNNDWLCLSLGMPRQVKKSYRQKKKNRKISNLKGCQLIYEFSKMMYWIFLVSRYSLENSLAPSWLLTVVLRPAVRRNPFKRWNQWCKRCHEELLLDGPVKLTLVRFLCYSHVQQCCCRNLPHRCLETHIMSKTLQHTMAATNVRR